MDTYGYSEGMDGPFRRAVWDRLRGHHILLPSAPTPTPWLP